MNTNYTIFTNSDLTKLIMAILVYKVGGLVTITQQDINFVAYNFLNETQEPDGSIKLEYKKKNFS